MARVLHCFIFLTLFFSSVSLTAQRVNINARVDGFRHNWDCCSDGSAFNCVFGSQPEPRYKVWVGYNGGSFLQSTSGPGLAAGCGTTYGSDDISCTTWNPGKINLPAFNNVNASSYNVDLQSWEYDGGLPCCTNNNCNPNTDVGGCTFLGIPIPCFNPDDIRCPRTRIADINYWVNPPDCNYYDWNGEFTSGSFLSMAFRCGDQNGAGYGIQQLELNWGFQDAPTITLQPTDASVGGPTRSSCPNYPPPTLTFSVNSFNGWTLGRNVKWQVSPNGTSGWVDIAGSTIGPNNINTTYSYTPLAPASIPAGGSVVQFYRAVASSDCGNTFTRSTPTSAVQITWYSNTNPLCTPASCNTVYVDPVSGNDVLSTGSGSTSNPYRTISFALSVNPSIIRVVKGAGVEPNVCNIIDNVVIEGGYTRSGSNWEKSSATTDATTITFSGIEAPTSSNRHIAAFKSSAKTNWAVKDINITTTNVPANIFAGDGKGLSNYGFLIINNSTNYLISRCNITVGNAGNGANGTTPANGGGALGGAGGNGSTGCRGSEGGCNVPTGNSGAIGGGVGSPVNTNGGAAISKGWGCTDVRSGEDGRAGSIGATGYNGTNGSNGSAYILNGTYFTPGGNGQQGISGGGGQGGGGGSGSIGGAACVWNFGPCACGSCEARNGATGGQGGQGGSGGFGGAGGGGAFGIWRSTSSTGSTITEVNIPTVGIAGAGGIGAIGSNGLAGVIPASAACVGCNILGFGFDEHCAGDGGRGGTGGRGGFGGNGLPGTTAFMMTDGVASNPSVSVVSPNSIFVDYFSRRLNLTGLACRNSEIDLRTTIASPSWSFSPAGLSLVNDLTPVSTSFTNTQASIKVTTNSSNVFYDLTVGTTFKNGLYVKAQTPTDRTLPVITYPDSEICEDGSVSNSVTGWDVANVLQREWLVYDSLLVTSSPSSPLYSSSASTPVFTGFDPGVGTYKAYLIRYRERHTCCGWSRPVFATIRVFPQPTKPGVVPTPNLLGVCPLTPVSATFTPGSQAVGCSFVYEYMRDGNGVWNAYTPGDTLRPMLGNTAIAIRARKICGTGAANVTTNCNIDTDSTYEWSVLQAVNRGLLENSDQSDSTALCSTPTPTPADILFQTFPSGAGGFTYQWYYKDVLGVIPPDCPVSLSGISGWTAIAGATNPGYSPATGEVAAGHSRTYAVYVTPNNGGGTSAVCGVPDWAIGCRKITVLPTFNIGTIASGDQSGVNSFCANTGTPPDPNNIAFSTPPAGSGGFDYQWYYKVNNTTTPEDCPVAGSGTSGWTLIAGANTQNYNPAQNEVTQGTSRTYACFVTPTAASGSTLCGTGDWANSCRKITVLPTFNLGTITSGDQSLCDNLSSPPTPNPITFSSLPIGSGNFTYQWYYLDAAGATAPACPTGSTIPGGWISTGAANGGQTATYSPPAGAIAGGNSRTYACFVTPTAGSLVICGAAGWANSCRKITMLAVVNYGTVSGGPYTLCTPADPSVFSTTGQSGGSPPYGYQWYYIDGDVTPPAGTNNTTGWTLIAGANANVYDPPAGLTTTRSYAVTINPNVACGGALWATGRGLVNVISTSSINRGQIVSQPFGGTHDTVCVGAATTVAKIVSFAGGVAPSTPSPTTLAYQWYRKSSTTDTISPTPGSTVTTGWTLIAGATSATYTPNLTGLTTAGGYITFAVMIDQTGTPDCDVSRWSTGSWKVWVVPDPIAPTFTPIPAASLTYCIGQTFTVVNTAQNFGTNTPIPPVPCVVEYNTSVNSATATGTWSTTVPVLTAATSGAVYRIFTRTNCGTTLPISRHCGSGANPSVVNGLTYSWTAATVSDFFTTNSVTPTVLCVGGTVNLNAVTSSGTGVLSWIRSATIGGAAVATLTPGVATEAPPLGTWYYRPRKTGGTPNCITEGTTTTVTVVTDPSISTATKSPDVPTVCAGTALTMVTPVIGSGGTGTCNVEYRISNSPQGTTSWSTIVPNISAATTATPGTYTIEVSTFCNGAGCDRSTPTAYTWTVVADPSATATKSPNTATACEGATLTLTSPIPSGGTGTCLIEYQTITPAGGTSAWTSTIPTISNAVIGTNTINIRRSCDGLNCTTGSNSYTWTVVADPSAPTATKSPNVPSVCEGTTLSITGVTTPAGGTGTCVTEYSINGGAFSTSFSPFTATVGTNTVTIRRNCDGADCDISAENIYSWVVVDDPVAPAATKLPADNIVCVGQLLDLSSVNDLGGGTGTCVIEYSVNGGAYTTILTPFAAVPGANTINVRKSCSGSDCNPATSTFTWTAVAQPAIPSAVKSPNVPIVCEGELLSLTGIVDNGGGTGNCDLEYSFNGGAYSTTLTPTAAIVGVNTISIRKNCDGTGCNNSTPAIFTWTGVEDPIAPTATQSPADVTVCSGAVLTLTGITDNGGGTGTCITEYQTITPATGTSAWSTTLPSISSTITGTYTINMRKSCNGANCNLSPVTAYTWTVVAEPTVTALEDITYCRTTLTTKRLRTTVSGGTGNFTFTWQYSLNNITWFNIPGSNPSGINFIESTSATNSSLIILGNGTEATQDYYYRCYVTSTDAAIACNVYTNVSTITVVNRPSITNPVPATQTACLSTTPTDLTVSATGGSPSPYYYIWRVDTINTIGGGTTLADTIDTVTPSTSVVNEFYYYTIVTQPESGCIDTSATAEVIIINAPVITTTKIPNLPGVCEGTSVSANISIVGGSGCIDTIQYEYDNSGTWTNYTSGNSISSTGHTNIRIRVKRGDCSCSTPFQYTTWTVNDKPDASSASVLIDNLCGSTALPYANLSAANPTPYTGTWIIQSGPGTLVNSTSYNTARIINMTPGVATTVRWFADNSGCSDFKDTTITPSSTSFDPNTIATVDNCRNCTVRNGNVYSFYNSSGHIVAQIEDYASPTVELALTEVCLDMLTYTPTTVPTVYTSYGDYQPYLPRRWSIDPINSPSASHVTLYFTQAEFNALQTAATGTNYQFTQMTDLQVTKFDGGSGGVMTNPPVYPAIDNSAVLLATTFKRYPNLVSGPHYSVEFDVSNYSTFYVHPISFPNAPLPIELVSFTGWNQNNVNMLQWVTASEINTLKFEIQKSTALSSWNTIGEQSAAGNSTSTITYNFTDTDPLFGNNYYRLKIIDIDGSISYSNIINIPLSGVINNSLIGIYPNPTNGLLNVDIQSKSAYTTEIMVYDVLGKEITGSITDINKGLNRIQLDFSLLAKGAYVLQYTDEDGKIHKAKFVKD